MGRRHVAAISALGAGLLAAATIPVAPEPAVAAPAASVLGKSAQNLTHPGANPVGHGDTVNWVLDYAGSGTGPATVTDPITGAGATQSYVPGSLRVPPGWTPRWSTDGTTFGTTDPGAGTVAVRADTPAARPGGTTLDTPLQPPVQAAPTQTGGDGFTPILHRTAAGTTEAWNMYHHAGPGVPKLVCTDLATNTRCAGGPWPKQVSTAPGSFDGGAGDVGSTTTPTYVTDPGTGLTYYPAMTGSQVGVGCLDFAARANCGFWPLAPAAPGGAYSLAGVVTTGGNLWAVGTNGRPLCLTTATRTPCAGQPYPAIVPPNNNGPGGIYQGSAVVVGTRLFASSAPRGGARPALGCFDTATLSPCAGWPAAKEYGTADWYTYNAFAAYDTSGAPAGVCSTAVNGAGNPRTACFTLAGAPLSVPSLLTQPSAGTWVFDPVVVTTPDGHLRSYFGAWQGGSAGSTTCYDWTTAGPCAGFPDPAFHPTVNGGVTRDYGYAYDTTTDCLIALGDSGVLFSVDPRTGASPCIHSGASAALHPASFYCDGGTGHVRGYRDARLENIDMADVDLAASRVEVRDTGGGPIPTPGLAPDGTVDLSGVPVAQHPDITVTVSLVLTGAGDFTGPDRPVMVLGFDGDAPQVCFRTTVSADCAVTGVTNTASGTDATGGFTSGTVSLAVAPGAGCQPTVTVDKEICAANDAHHCLAGGPGPWVKQAPVGILGLLYAHPYWRITVTNSGPVAITGATLVDQAEPSCVTAAGTFDLAAGAGRQVYCDTSVLLSLLPMTNTAAVRYTPANSPAGTPPTTSASSSARACPLLCLLG
jgi:hypothetical protein